jgi:hypothetical protein
MLVATDNKSGAGRSRNRSSICGKAIIPFFKGPDAYGDHQSSYSVPNGGSFAGVNLEVMKLFTHLHVIQRVGITGAWSPLSNMPSWRAQI